MKWSESANSLRIFCGFVLVTCQSLIENLKYVVLLVAEHSLEVRFWTGVEPLADRDSASVNLVLDVPYLGHAAATSTQSHRSTLGYSQLVHHSSHHSYISIFISSVDSKHKQKKETVKHKMKFEF